MPYLANCAEVKIDPSNRVNDDVIKHLKAAGYSTGRW